MTRERGFEVSWTAPIIMFTSFLKQLYTLHLNSACESSSISCLHKGQSNRQGKNSLFVTHSLTCVGDIPNLNRMLESMKHHLFFPNNVCTFYSENTFKAGIKLVSFFGLNHCNTTVSILPKQSLPDTPEKCTYVIYSLLRPHFTKSACTNQLDYMKSPFLLPFSYKCSLWVFLLVTTGFGANILCIIPLSD